MAGDSIIERERFEEGLNTKVKLNLYKTFGKAIEFKRYLHGVADAGSRLLFKFRSGTHGINEELGRHRGREGNKECVLCGNECESVSHVLWECSAYSNSRADFLLKLQEKLGNGFERFNALDSLGKSSFILGYELWEEHSSQSQSSTGDLGECTGIEGQSGKNMCQASKPDT